MYFEILQNVERYMLVLEILINKYKIDQVIYSLVIYNYT